jgi:BON domain-containing protein
MKRLMLIAAMLVFSLGLPAQQQAPPAPDQQQVPGQTPPTFPEDHDPGVRPVPPDMPPDIGAAPGRELSSSEVRDQIQTKLNSEPGLENDRVRVSVTDSDITVTGAVDDEAERELALRIAESYAGDRNIVDKLEIRGKA